MKKKLVIVTSIILLVAIAIGVAYAIDMNRMKNNQPVVFSTWGYQYVPPVNDYPLQTNNHKNSFVGKVLEETTSYMIVEPIEDKADGDMGEKVKVEYGTDHYDYFYGIGRMVVIYFEGKLEETNDGMKLVKSDDISTEGFREFELEVETSAEKQKRLALSDEI